MDRKALNLPILISLAVGNMIGTGIYVLPAALAQYGTAALTSWVITCVGALMIALVYASMNKRFPVTGGPYVYSKEAFGKLAGFVIGYVYWMSTMVSVAAIAIATTGYLGYLFPMLDANLPAYNRLAVVSTELLFVWIFTGINLWGIHNAGVVQLILTIIKIIPLVFITLFGIFYIHPVALVQDAISHSNNFSAISSAASLTFWAFVGLEAATIPAENTKGPKHIFIATVFGTLITGILYLSSTFVLMGLIPLDQLKTSQFPFATAGILLFGTQAAIIVTICTIASGLGTLNSTILLQGQVVFAAARDHMFPKSFAKLSKHDVPVQAQLLSCGIITVVLATTVSPSVLKQFDFVAMLATLLTLFTYLATTLAGLKFDFMTKKSFFKPITLIGMLAAIYACWTIANFTLAAIAWGIIITVLCIPFYYFTVRNAE